MSGANLSQGCDRYSVRSNLGAVPSNNTLLNQATGYQANGPRFVIENEDL